MLLTVNSGSSSVRLDLFPAAGEEPSASRVLAGDMDPGAALQTFLPEAPQIIAHRVVHGGAQLTKPCLIDADVEKTIQDLAPLAPLHNPRALTWIRAARRLYGETVPQIALFDTAFFAGLPARARDYALPQALVKQYGIRRYGFHGLAHQAMCTFWSTQAGLSQPAQQTQHSRVITLQLGSGCSIAAIENGQPVDTSMGFSPLEGLMMATRSGDIDPGILLFLQGQGRSVDEIDTLLSHESGLLGVSGISADMRLLLRDTSAQAQHAIDLYCYRARKYIGAYLSVLGGADALIFGGGVGEHAPEIRARILRGMEWAGLHLDPARNCAATQGNARIDEDARGLGRIAIWVCAVNEAAILAQQAQRWIKAQT